MNKCIKIAVRSTGEIKTAVSDDFAIETIEANEYEFTKDGKRY